MGVLIQNGMEDLEKTDPIAVPDRAPNITKVDPSWHDWVKGPLIPGLAGTNDYVIVNWTGYLTAPQSTNYKFCIKADNGYRLSFDNKVHIDNWGSSGTKCGSTQPWAAGESKFVKIEYFEKTGTASMRFQVEWLGNTRAAVPNSWLTPAAKNMPDGWSLLATAGGVAYQSLRETNTSVLVYDAYGTKSTFKKAGSGYASPEGVVDSLRKNSDGTFTIQAVDGRSYLFDKNGLLISTTSVGDERQPTALKYEHSGNPARIRKIIDPIDDSRYGSIYYGGDSECPSVPSGFDQAPAGMICSFVTTDGTFTNMHYLAGNLARISSPGEANQDFGYDTYGRITSYRDVLANDVIVAGVRPDDASVTYEISYDLVGRATSATLPAGLQGDTRAKRDYRYYYENELNVSSPSSFGEVAYDSLSATSMPGSDRIDLFGRSSSGKLMHRFYLGNEWSDWKSLGGCIRGKPGALNWSDGSVRVWVRGCNDKTYQKDFRDGVWHSFIGLGGNIRQGITATGWGDDRIYLYSVNSSKQLVQKRWMRGQGWTGWTVAGGGGCISGAPSATSWGDHRLDIFVKGCDKSGIDNIYHLNFNGKAWSKFAKVGGAIAESLGDAVSYDSKKLGLSIRKVNGDLTMLTWNAVQSWKWTDLNACSGTSPALVAMNNGQMQAFSKNCSNNELETMHLTAISGSSETSEEGHTEPEGYSSRITYDTSLRTVTAAGKDGLESTSTWDQSKDLVKSVVDPLGLKNTAFFNTNDVQTKNYSTAPEHWFGADNRPLPAYESRIARTDSKYDENINGLSTSWYEVRNKTLFGAPKAYSTGLNTVEPEYLAFNKNTHGLNFSQSSSATGYGFSAEGIYIPAQSGKHTFRVRHQDGARLYVNGKELVNKWSDNGSVRQHDATITLIAGQSYDFRLEWYTNSDSSAGVRTLVKTPGSSTYVDRWGDTLKPNYNLQTSVTTRESDPTKDRTVSTSYGSNPEYGLPQSSSISTSDISYTSNTTYETPGDPGSYLRQTSRSLPGGNTTEYAYYGSTESIDNPCTTEVDLASQAGRKKLTTEQDPDGQGGAAARTKETIYDAMGRVVASRMNSDPWSCVSFDTRGRTYKTAQPDINGRVGRTITSFFDIDGNPLRGKSIDTIVGSTASEIDLLGRILSSTDIWGNEYTVSYDNIGRVTSKSGPIGTESYTYDTYDRATAYILDGIALAEMSYDSFSRVTGINYPEAKDAAGNILSLDQINRDELERTIGTVHSTSDSKTITESISLSTTGKITGASQTYDGQTLTSSFTFDGADRMASAAVGQTEFSYGYNAPDASCSATAGHNPNAHKNSNRTSYTVTNTLTGQVVMSDTHCYDLADKLTSSSDIQVGTPAYDDHGNTITLAGAGTAIGFEYDASNYNTAIEQGDTRIEYVKTPGGSVVRKKVYANGQLTKSFRYVSGGRIMQACDVADDNSCVNVDTYINLPGAVSLTKSPNHTDPAKQMVYSLKNYHGDTLLTLTSEGRTDSADNQDTNLLLAYGPFGEALIEGTLGAVKASVTNASDSNLGWAANPARKIEQSITLPLIQMGARVYIPSLGRFLQADPIEGGTLNAYVYAHDPVNLEDYSGQSFGSMFGFFFRSVDRHKGSGYTRRQLNKISPVSQAKRTITKCTRQILICSIAVGATAAAAVGVAVAGPPVVAAAGAAATAAAVRTAALVAPAALSAQKIATRISRLRVPSQAKSTWSRIKTNNFSSLGKGYKVQKFKNSDNLLPSKTTYTEFYLKARPYQGAERIIKGADGSVYYSPDHYKTFIRIE